MPHLASLQWFVPVGIDQLFRLRATTTRPEDPHVPTHGSESLITPRRKLVELLPIVCKPMGVQPVRPLMIGLRAEQAKQDSCASLRSPGADPLPNERIEVRGGP